MKPTKTKYADLSRATLEAKLYMAEKTILGFSILGFGLLFTTTILLVALLLGINSQDLCMKGI